VYRCEREGKGERKKERETKREKTRYTERNNDTEREKQKEKEKQIKSLVRSRLCLSRPLTKFPGCHIINSNKKVIKTTLKSSKHSTEVLLPSTWQRCFFFFFPQSKGSGITY
jgi:hypothetical protein